jgi:hypothetical protein
VTSGAQVPGEGDRADVIQQVVDNPAQFYLNVHWTAFPDGAIRGQIGR